MAFLDKVKDLLSKNADKVDTAIGKAGDIVDKKTQGKYAQHVDKVQDVARKAVDKSNANQSGQVPPTQQSGQVPPPQPLPGTPPQQQPPTAPPTP